LVGSLAGAAAALAVRYTIIAGSPEAGGRSLGEVRRYSAEWVDFVNRWHAPASEEFVYLGWLTPILALVGLALLLRDRRGLALFLGLAALVPLLLALGTNLPTYSPLWHTLPPLRFPRVPGRLLAIADLALAALAAFAAADLLRRAGTRAAALAAALLVLVAVDLAAQPLSATAADPGNAAYRALAAAPPGRVLELPLFEPGQHYGSVYDYYRLQEAREHPGGYSTVAPEAAFAFYFRDNRLSCGVWRPGDAQMLGSLGVTRVLFHRALYAQAHRRGAWFAWRALVSNGWQPLAQGGAVTLFAPGAATRAPPVPEPSRSRPYFCTGWRGRTTLARQATMWIYGEGGIQLHLDAPSGMHVRLLGDGRLLDQRRFAGKIDVRTTLVGMRWHPLLLVSTGVGMRVDEITF
jgi:hypothetical protein